MTTKPDEDFPDGPSEQDIRFVKDTWDHGWAEGYKAGRASRDRLREALKSFMADSECYCLNPEELLGRGPCAFCECEKAIAADERGEPDGK